MDAQVPGNNTEGRVTSRRPRGPYRRQNKNVPVLPSPVDNNIRRIRQLREAIEHREEERFRARVEEANRKPAARAKKPRRKYKVFNRQPETGQNVVTALDLVHMMPNGQAAFVICNPEKSLCNIILKEGEQSAKTETVAKPRYNTSNNTFIVTNKYQEEEDVDKIIQEFQQ